MSELVTLGGSSALWTIEEICRLASVSGNSTETLTNVVQFIQRRFQTDVCSVYLLEPDRLAWCWPRRMACVPKASAGCGCGSTKAWSGWWPNNCRPRSSKTPFKHPRFKYFPRDGRRPVPFVLGRAADRSRAAAGGARACKRPEPRNVLRRMKCGCSSPPARSLAPDRQRSPHAGAVHRAGPSTTEGAGPESVVELGRRGRQPVPRPRPGSLARTGPQSDRAAAADVDRQAGRAGRRSWPCTAASTTPIAACRSI